MKGEEMRNFRKAFGLTRGDFAIMLGYTGNPDTNKKVIRTYECDDRQIPLYIARLIWLIGMNRIGLFPSMEGQNRLPKWPDWPGYDFQKREEGGAN